MDEKALMEKILSEKEKYLEQIKGELFATNGQIVLLKQLIKEVEQIQINRAGKIEEKEG